MPKWERILVHHSAGPDGAISNYEQIRAQHLSRGWLDIGYHAVVELVGSRVIHRPGRPTTMNGSHCPGQNAHALGVCVIGNFETTEPSAAHLHALTDQLATWCAIYDISPTAIFGHRDFRATLCPGKHLYGLLPELRIATAIRLADL